MFPFLVSSWFLVRTLSSDLLLRLWNGRVQTGTSSGLHGSVGCFLEAVTETVMGHVTFGWLSGQQEVNLSAEPFGLPSCWVLVFQYPVQEQNRVLRGRPEPLILSN